jgi:amino-acid N-acetyltransferase
MQTFMESRLPIMTAMSHTFDIQIRPAGVGDVACIAAIINDYAERGRMLHRSHSELYESLRDYQVAERDGQVIGVVGLRIMWSNLAEVYALAVGAEARGQGLGKRLVLSAVDEAEQLGIRRVFALTYERLFFEKCGFHIVDRHQQLPLKVWSECVRCPKNQACDEIAMVRVLEVPELPETAGPPPQRIALDQYEVPVLSDRMRGIDREARQVPL